MKIITKQNVIDMSNCSVTFKKVFTQMKRGDFFSPFVSTDAIKNLDNIIEEIAQEAITLSEKSEKSVSFYNFKEATKKLKSFQKTYPALTDDIIHTIIDRMKTELSLDNYNTNPLIETKEGKVPLFDFNNTNKLVHGIESMEIYLDLQLEKGLFKSMFIHLSDGEHDEAVGHYTPFVVTDEDLNNNLKVYKSDL
jgi:hypothetical protein